jgi:hypothetical protein
MISPWPEENPVARNVLSCWCGANVGTAQVLQKESLSRRLWKCFMWEVLKSAKGRAFKGLDKSAEAPVDPRDEHREYCMKLQVLAYRGAEMHIRFGLG